MFQIGEFSRLSRVSRRLLHHYEELGIFKPARVDEFTGYRYYSAHQIPELNRILALKDLGFSLKQIKEVLEDDISDNEIRGMLRLKQAEVEQTLLHEQQRLRKIEARLQLAEKSEGLPDVVVKSIPAQHFLAARCQIKEAEEMLLLVNQIFEVVPAVVKPGNLIAFAGVVYTEEFRVEDNDVELGFLIHKPVKDPIKINETCTLTSRVLPAVKTMATAVQIGGPELVFVALGQIGQWIEQNGYRLDGPYREIVLESQTLSESMEAVIEIQVPIALQEADTK